jgi:hypothetical protein
VGFATELQARLGAVMEKSMAGGMVWELSRFSDADAWWVNGSRTQLLPDGTVRVAAGAPAGRSIQLNLPEIDRPIAFSTPLAARNFEPVHRFDPASTASMSAVLGKMELWLRPLAAQFCLAPHRP